MYCELNHIKSLFDTSGLFVTHATLSRKDGDNIYHVKIGECHGECFIDKDTVFWKVGSREGIFKLDVHEAV